VLTVKQPWAWAIIHGGKDVENRALSIAGGWRGTVAIHAGLASIVQAGVEHPEMQKLDPMGRGALRFGEIIGVVDLIEVHAPYAETELCSPWAETGAFHMKLANPRSIAPARYTGALGLRKPPARAITECICYWTEPSTWTMHYGAVEPGSQIEPCYDCPVHFPTENGEG
jgi:hypothetical protein